MWGKGGSEDDLVPAFVLGLVELLVGLADQFAARQGFVSRGGGHAQADGDSVWPPVIFEGMILDQGADAFAQPYCSFPRGLRQDQGKFLAALAGKQLFHADAALDAGRQLTQSEVAAQMAQVVVDRFEQVQVKTSPGPGAGDSAPSGPVPGREIPACSALGRGSKPWVIPHARFLRQEIEESQLAGGSGKR